MKKRRLRFLIVAGVICLCTMFTVVLAEPGSNDDPLISKSYIEDYLMPKIEQLIESKLAGLGGSTGSGNTTEAESFVVVEAKAGEKIICSAGAELILRMGKATVVATEKGGLADTTAGYDLSDGTAMPSNHLLIVPVADGRGIKADTDIIVMIKGGYKK